MEKLLNSLVISNETLPWNTGRDHAEAIEHALEHIPDRKITEFFQSLIGKIKFPYISVDILTILCFVCCKMFPFMLLKGARVLVAVNSRSAHKQRLMSSLSLVSTSSCIIIYLVRWGIKITFVRMPAPSIQRHLPARLNLIPHAATSNLNAIPGTL